MKELNDQLLKVKAQMRERERLIKMLNNAKEEKRILEEKKDNLYKQLKKEELDVEKLEGISLTNFIITITGRKTERLEKEKKEAIAAKLKYDVVKDELMDLIEEIKALEKSIQGLGDLEFEYRNVIARKEKILKSMDTGLASRLDRITEEESTLMDKRKELEEAIYAGKELLSSLDRVNKSLDSAKSWGTWDILGGDFIATMGKHSRIDDAKREISKAQLLLSRFHRELEDVGGKLDINIEIGSFLTFADYFFDGLFSDLAVQSKINDAKQKVVDTKVRVNTVIRNLEEELKDTEDRIKNLNRERLNIIEQA